MLDGEDDKIKLSCKGISKKFVHNPLEIFCDEKELKYIVPIEDSYVNQE